MTTMSRRNWNHWMCGWHDTSCRRQAMVWRSSLVHLRWYHLSISTKLRNQTELSDQIRVLDMERYVRDHRHEHLHWCFWSQFESADTVVLVALWPLCNIRSTTRHSDSSAVDWVSGVLSWIRALLFEGLQDCLFPTQCLAILHNDGCGFDTTDSYDWVPAVSKWFSRANKAEQAGILCANNVLLHCVCTSAYNTVSPKWQRGNHMYT